MGPVHLLALIVLCLALISKWLLTSGRSLPLLRLSVRLVFVIAVLITLVYIPAFISVHVVRLVRRPGSAVNIV